MHTHIEHIQKMTTAELFRIRIDTQNRQKRRAIQRKFESLHTHKIQPQAVWGASAIYTGDEERWHLEFFRRNSSAETGTKCCFPVYGGWERMTAG